MSDSAAASLANLLDYKDVIISRLKGDDLKQAVKRLKDVMKVYIELEHQTHCSAKVLDKGLCTHDDKVQVFDDLEHIFKNKLEKEQARQPVDVQSHQKWKLLEREIQEAITTHGEASADSDQPVEFNDSQGSDEIAAVAESIQTIDPITKKVMENPVKNIRCNHVYEKSSILEMIKRSRKFKCPQMGCVNKFPIRESDLVDDPELLRQIKRIASKKT